jgi:protocatechuate 3,4-dioxygenase beta subunit
MKAHLNCIEPFVRRLLILGVVALSAPAQMPKSEPANLCSVEGQVVDAATGAPVPKALLTLRDRISSAPNDRPDFFTTTSDAAGRFVFRELQPGSYDLAGGARGYVLLASYNARQPRRSGTRFSLAPGQNLTGITLRLTPNSAVSGRIVDEDGDPMSSLQVQLLRVSYRSGKRELVVDGSHKAGTDDRGLYRIWGVTPGKYYLSAVYPPARPTEDARYVPTYYPGTIDEAAAAPIDMGPATELESINLSLSKVRTVRVRGRVLDVASPHVFLRRESIVSGDERNYTSVSVGPDGQFEFRGLLPGTYTLVARTNDVDRRASALRSVTVGAADLDGLTISMLPAILITGHVSVDGESRADLSNTRIELRSYPNAEAWGAPTGTATKDATTRIVGVDPDRYKVIVPDTPDGFYLKAVRLGGRDLPGQVLDVTAGGPAQIEVVLSPKAASVTGTVALASSDEPAAEVTVVLIPQEKERRDDPLAYLRTMTDDSGKFTIRNIVPGEYRAFAWEDVEYGIYMDPDFIRPIESKGVAVTLAESAAMSVKLNAIAP